MESASVNNYSSRRRKDVETLWPPPRFPSNLSLWSSTHGTKVVQVQMGPFLTQQQQEVPSKAAFGVQRECGVPNEVPSRKSLILHAEGKVQRGWRTTRSSHWEPWLHQIESSSCNWTVTILQNDCIIPAWWGLTVTNLCGFHTEYCSDTDVDLVAPFECPLHCLHMEVLYWGIMFELRLLRAIPIRRTLYRYRAWWPWLWSSWILQDLKNWLLRVKMILTRDVSTMFHDVPCCSMPGFPLDKW